MGNIQQSYYEVLGISANTDEKKIKKAYKQLIRKYNPEHHPEKFKEIRHAYDMIMKPPLKTHSFPLYQFPVEWLNNNYNVQKKPKPSLDLLAKLFETPFNTTLEIQKYMDEKLKSLFYSAEPVENKSMDPSSPSSSNSKGKINE